MSTIKSSDEHLTLNADGSSKDIKFQANGVEKASISSSGAFTSTTIDATKLTGNLPAISGASLTGVLPLAGGTLTGDLLVTSTQPNIRLTDSDSGGYYSKVAQEGASMKIVADLGEVGSGRLRFYNGSGAEKLEITADGRGLSQFTAKFWCKFNGSGTLAVNDSHNVSSVTDVGTGDYRVNFANAMGNAHYSVHVQSQTTATWTGQWDNIHSTATSFVGFDHKEGGTNTDTSRVNVLGFGD